MDRTGSAKRHDWIDIAKAISIVLVVFGHELVYFGAHSWSRGTATEAFWDGVGAYIVPFRMPLFFLASGLLAASSLKRDWSEAFNKRVFRHLYLYLLWGGIFALLIPAWPSLGMPVKDAATTLTRLATGFSPAWYLWALPIAFLIGWITRKQPAWVPIAAASVLLFLPVDHTYSGNIYRCLAYFLAGLRVPGLAAQISARADGKLFAGGLAAFVLLLALEPAAPFQLMPLAEFAGVATAALGCVLLSRASAAAVRAGRWLGRRTLPIYLFHFPILAWLEFRAIPRLPQDLLADPLFVAASPVLATAATVALCLLLERVLRTARLTWLLEMPRPAVPEAPVTLASQATSRAGQG